MFKLIRFMSLVFAVVFVPCATADPLVIKHYQKHDRYQYGEQLLDLALSKLGIDYEIKAPASQDMNEARGELSVIAGDLDVQWMSASARREASMIAIRVPIYRWILGMRLLLVENERLAELGRIGALDDLKQYTAVHGKHWGDLPVYAANQLPVTTLVKYESLFKLLTLGRADYFHRGLNEIWDEAERYKSTLGIADNVMLFYPHPVYFFVTPGRQDLARKIEQGLQLAQEDGSFKRHFLAYHQRFIDKARLDARTLIVLENPVLPDSAPEIDTHWWLPEKFEVQIKQALGSP